MAQVRHLKAETVSSLTRATGIGKATAALLAEEGCQKIVIADRNVESLDAVVASIKNHHPGTDVKTTFVDVKSETSVEQMVEYVVKTFGRIDYCANVAGIIRYGDTSVLSVEDFDEVQSINLRGIFLCAKAEITAMLLQKPLQNKYSLCNPIFIDYKTNRLLDSLHFPPEVQL